MSRLRLVPAISLLSLWFLSAAVAPAWGLSAIPSDHIGGATASWTHSSDGVRTSTGFLPEALGFKFGLGLTVFESADTQGRVPLIARLAAYRTGRIEPELYFHGDDGGRSLLEAESSWFLRTFGRRPAALSYALGDDSDSAIVPDYVFGARNSAWDFGTAYGASVEQSSTSLGAPRTDFTSAHYASMASTTRVFDMGTWPRTNQGQPNPNFGQPIETVIATAAASLQSAISSRGWYNDFAHWSTPKGPDLYRYFQSQASVMETTSSPVARVSYGDAVSHRFLRDSARLSIEQLENGAVRLQIRYVFPSRHAPLSAITTPLSVRVDLAGSSLEGLPVSVNGASVRDAEGDDYLIDVPFKQYGSTVWFTTSDWPVQPRTNVVQAKCVWDGDVLIADFDRPVKAALFVASSNLASATSADVVWRSSEYAIQHHVDLAAPGQSIGGDMRGNISAGNRMALFLGGVDSNGRSLLVQVSDAKLATTRILADAPSIAPYKAAVTLRARLLDASSTPLPVQSVYVERLRAGQWSRVASATRAPGEPGGYVLSVVPAPSGASEYRFRYEGLVNRYEASASPTLSVTPRARVTTPNGSVRASVGRSFSVGGRLLPKHPAGAGSVRVYRYRYVGDTWVSYGSANAVLRTGDGFTAYSATMRLPRAGKWRLRAYAPADSAHAAAASSYHYVTVR